MASDGPRYRVLKKLAEGGMAEIFLAERSLPGRAATTVALKRVRPQLRDDAAVVGMLEDEIGLGLRCSHPNVIATLGSGNSDGHQFAVLEYVDGLDLSSLLETLRTRGQILSRSEAVHVALKITSALKYLHKLEDSDGQPLGIVHRDVTPPNVLLGRNGDVKLCDFGFVRSRQQRTITEPGFVKGKFSYLSPEAARGETIEQRSDLFAVGIIIWEMLTMRRLFHGKTDYDTVKLVQVAKVPSMATVGADVDEVLEEIVRRALASKPEDRFQSADGLHNSLAAYADWAGLEADLQASVKKACTYREGRATKMKKKKRNKKPPAKSATRRTQQTGVTPVPPAPPAKPPAPHPPAGRALDATPRRDATGAH